MNFELTEDQKLLQEMVRSFVRNEIEPVANTLEEKHEFPHTLINKLSELGIFGMSVPSKYSGSKTDAVSLLIAIEEISWALPSLAVILSVHSSLFCYSISRFGSKEQKRKYLPKAAHGKILGAFSMSEPGAGSDISNLQTHAVRSEDSYIINGRKSWVTTGHDAGAMILFAKTPTQQDENKLSAFIVDQDAPGLQVSKIEEKMGLHSSLTAEITLEDCRVSKENLLGQEGQGASLALHCLDCSRMGIAAQSVGLSQRALDESLGYARQREAFGKKIADFQAIQFMLADISMLIEAGRLLTYRAANLFDHGKPFTKESAMAKLFASEAANKIAYHALQIHGGYGYSKEFSVERIYRDARVLTLYEGTSEIQRLVISRDLLKA